MQVGKRMMEFDFNPRSPHGERREAAAALRRGAEFQSTLPARGATLVFVALCGTLSFQSTLPARGATRHCNPADAPQPEIFQPTLPARGATVGADVLFHPAFRISIHAPRTGSDSWGGRAFPSSVPHFNPRSPHGERRRTVATGKIIVGFQSTLPARGATGEQAYRVAMGTFQSTLPARGATTWRRADARSSGFQSTLPARGATSATPFGLRKSWKNFNPRSPHGERRQKHIRR